MIAMVLSLPLSLKWASSSSSSFSCLFYHQQTVDDVVKPQYKDAFPVGVRSQGIVIWVITGGFSRWVLASQANSYRLDGIYMVERQSATYCLNHSRQPNEGFIAISKTSAKGPMRQRWLGTLLVNLSPPGQNGRHFADDIFKCIFFNENVLIVIKISLKCIPIGPISNDRALVQIMAWHRPFNKPLSEPVLTRFTDT